MRRWILSLIICDEKLILYGQAVLARGLPVCREIKITSSFLSFILFVEAEQEWKRERERFEYRVFLFLAN